MDLTCQTDSDCFHGTYEQVLKFWGMDCTENKKCMCGSDKRRYVIMLHEVSFASFNGRDQVQGWIYVPACKPKGIVQVIHGFGEHSRRYLHMISAIFRCRVYCRQQTIMSDMEKLRWSMRYGAIGETKVRIQ